MSTLDYVRLQTSAPGTLSARTQRQLFLIGLLLVDVVALAAAALVAYAFRFLLGIDVFQDVNPSGVFYVRLLAILIPYWVLLFFLFHLYDFHFLLGGTHEYARILNASTFGMMFVIIVVYYSQTIVSRGWTVSLGVCGPLYGLARFGMRRSRTHCAGAAICAVRHWLSGLMKRGARSRINCRRRRRAARTCSATRMTLHLPGERIGDLPVLGQVNQLPEFGRAARSRGGARLYDRADATSGS